MDKPLYKRVLLKLSGEAFLGKRSYGIDPSFVDRMADEIKEVQSIGVDIAIVIGGGNIFRGRDTKNFERVNADYMGMLATMMNGIALQDALEKKGAHTRLLSGIEMRQLAEPYIRRRAKRHLEKGRIVIFGAGIGNPYFSTDTAASLRALEIGAQVLLKGTKVEGVFSQDPKENQNAKMFPKISYIELLKKNLKVMDATAISLCMDNHLPIVVFNVMTYGNIKRVIMGENVGTIIS